MYKNNPQTKIIPKNQTHWQAFAQKNVNLSVIILILMHIKLKRVFFWLSEISGRPIPRTSGKMFFLYKNSSFLFNIFSICWLLITIYSRHIPTKFQSIPNLLKHATFISNLTLCGNIYIEGYSTLFNHGAIPYWAKTLGTVYDAA